MNLNLNEERINYISPICKCRFTREETMEVIVPDSMPDIVRVIDADAMPFMRGKDADTGRMAVSGIAEAVVLYVPESGGSIKRLEVSMPFSATHENAEITSECLLTAAVTLSSTDVRAINPRKLLIKLELCYELGAYLPDSKSMPCGMNEPHGDIQMLETARELMLPSSVSEKTFVLTDELSVPVAKPAIGEILRYSACVLVDECRGVGTKALAKGTVLTTILYRSNENSLEKVEFSSKFSQIIETEATEEAERYEVLAMTTGAYVSRGLTEDSGNETLSLELHAVLQCISYKKTDIKFISDAYSTKHVLAIESQDVSLECCGEEHVIPVATRGLIPTSSPGNVAMVNVKTGPVNRSENNGTISLTSMIGVCILYTDPNGDVITACRRMEATCETDIPASCPVDAIAVWRGDVSVSIVADGFDVNIPIEFKICCYENQKIAAINCISYDDKNVIDVTCRPSLIVYKVSAGDCLWELGKKYLSSRDEILSANGLEGEGEIKAGDILIIPKKR